MSNGVNNVMQKIEVDNFSSKDKANLNFWLSMVEKYDYDKILSICLSAGTTPDIAERIANEIDVNLNEEDKEIVSMSEVRKLIFALLYKYDWEAAKRFKTDEIYIRTNSEKFEVFRREKITKSLVKETGITENQANAISMDVEKFIRHLNLTYISSALIREITNVRLLEYGLEEARKKYTRIGLPIYDIEQMISKGASTDIKRENANLQHTPETINWIISGETLEQYAMMKLFPQHLLDPHISGDYHVHILSNAATRPNCIQHVPSLFFKYGLKVDGTGTHTSIAGPAKHLSVAIQHCAKIMLASQTQMAGGQSIDCFNVWLAPFLKGLSDESVRRAAQEFIYELNQSYVARGGQVVFSNILFEFGIPNWLKNVPAIGPSGKEAGVYGDYEEESIRFLREYTKIKIKGDHVGKQHMWPNDVYKVRKGDFEKYPEEMKLVHEFMAKYGTPYIANGLPEWQTENFNYMGCRTRLDAAYAGVWGSQRTGNDIYITLNLPRIAYEAREDDNKFFEILNKRLSKMAEILLIKHKISEDLLHKQHLLKFLSQKMGDEEYYNFMNTTKTFGYTGLTEAVKFHTGNHLHENKDAQEFGVKIIKRIREYAGECTKVHCLRFSVIASPAETCAARLAKIDIAKFGKNVINAGTKEAPYYTNSHMVRMDANFPLAEKIKIEEAYHPLTNGGHILHIWLGEQSPSADSLLEMSKKICQKDIGFFAYTKDFSVCTPCSNFEYGLKPKCENCGSEDLSRYSRITGYYQKVEGWNPSKKQELKDRFRYGVGNCGCD
ncbi:anaerobic ribonucleoside-triphosphate reductase [Candidatus Woesearchaeota archaeon CG10_big_fil_rev_8_21_14_0_10_34_12]|nr:MAG: anaerobic ribonucleoside-triphosphate reductase [Candidatus Woesearchaeota archaeon CG10_big_fil_rev_8_21_14_0_10_34_12]